MVVNETRGIERLRVDSETKEHLKLQKACRDFEAFLVSYMLRQMWQAAEAIGSEKPFMTQAYRDMFTFELAQSLIPSMRLGIAETLYRELSMSLGSEEGSGGENQ